MDTISLRVLRWGLALLIASCVALIGLGVYQAAWNAPSQRREHKVVVAALQVISTGLALDRAIRDAELSQRNVAITGDAGYRASYRVTVEKTRASLAELDRLTSGDTEQHRRFQEIQHQVEIRLKELRGMTDAQGAGRPDAILKRMAAILESPTARSVSQLVDTMIEAEKGRLQAAEARAASSARSARNVTAATGLLALGIMALGGFLVLYASRNIRRFDRARQESEEQFRLLVSGVTDYAIFRLDPRGRVVTWNAGAERIKGYAAGEILGESFERFYPAEDRVAGAPQRALEIAAREGRCEMEGQRVRKDGTRFWASVVIDRLSDASGRLLGYAKIVRDITERRRQQDALERARSDLAQSQKMEALGQLTGGIAHDFNNLLTVIGSAVGMVQRRQLQPDPTMDRLIDTVQRGVERATRLTQRLLAFARRQPLDPKPLEVNTLVTGVIEMARRSLTESIAIEVRLVPELSWVSADASQLESAVLNLIINARDAMPGGGKLTLETAHTFLDEAYAATHADVIAGEYVMITVADTGKGMSKEVAARAFEPFFTTKEIGQGTGLGLSQVHGFIKQSNGHVNIYSEPGVGATVRIYLPRLHRASVPEETAEGRPVAGALRRRTVLVVEDDPDVRAFTAEALSEHGYRVLAAADAPAAWAVLEQEPVDLLFTDIGIPGGANGRELGYKAQRRWPALKVLFTTGHAHNAFIHEERLDRNVELIRKPYTQTSLAERIQRVLGGTSPQLKDEGGRMKDDPRASRGS
jgi:PAS domain S-box-containing protein